MRSVAEIIASLGRGYAALGSRLEAHPATAAGEKPVVRGARLPSCALDRESSRFVRIGSGALAAVSRCVWTRLQTALGAFVILALVLAVYHSILLGSFLMDDEKLIRWDNPIVNGKLGPLSVWFSGDFALSTFVFWLQW